MKQFETLDFPISRTKDWIVIIVGPVASAGFYTKSLFWTLLWEVSWHVVCNNIWMVWRYKKKEIPCYLQKIVVFKFYDFEKTVRKTGCAVRGFWVIIERFSRRRPRKSRDNHSKTSNRASCVPNSFPEKAQNLKCAFSWTLFSFTSEQIFHCSEENNANPRKRNVS